MLSAQFCGVSPPCTSQHRLLDLSARQKNILTYTLTATCTPPSCAGHASSSSSVYNSQHIKRGALFRAHAVQDAEEEVTAYQSLMLEPVRDDAALTAECAWLADSLTAWLDEEWTPLEVHRQLGERAAQVYARVRLRGEDDVSEVLMSVVRELLHFNYRETFTDAFEVGNKVAELAMMRGGHEVCCGGAQTLGAPASPTL